MNLKKIKVAKWYKTKAGVGLCTKVGGTFPPTAQFRIVYPLPRGIGTVVPRDVEGELTDLEVKQLGLAVPGDVKDAKVTP
jgi:hypothetical protein